MDNKSANGANNKSAYHDKWSKTAVKVVVIGKGAQPKCCNATGHRSANEHSAKEIGGVVLCIFAKQLLERSGKCKYKGNNYAEVEQYLT